MTVATEKDYDRFSLTEEERRGDTFADPKETSPRSGSNGHHSNNTSPSRSGVNRDIRRMSLLETMVLQNHYDPYTNVKEQYIFNPSSDQLTVGDIVRVQESPSSVEQEGIVVEKVNSSVLLVDFGEKVREVALSHCTLLMRSDEFEVGDKVEARPNGSNLFFVGKVIKVNSDNKTMDVLMEGDDPNDIEYAVLFENARKLVSRRNIVVNRWKRAFMMVVAANLFKKIHFGQQQPSHQGSHHHHHHKHAHQLEAK